MVSMYFNDADNEIFVLAQEYMKTGEAEHLLEALAKARQKRAADRVARIKEMRDEEENPHQPTQDQS